MCVDRPGNVINCSEDDDSDLFLAGRCLFFGEFTSVKLQGSLSNITDRKICSKRSRSNFFCSSCDNETGLAINSYNFECINATRCHAYNWAIYLVTDFVVLTVFFLAIVVFNIKATAECAGSFILYAQVITLPFNLIHIERDWAAVLSPKDEEKAEILSWLIDITYGIWSLKVPSGAFFKLCPDKDTTLLIALAMRYSTAIFPLIFIGLFYVLLKLYQRDFKLVTTLWSPFRACCTRFRRRIDSNSNVVNAFATFVLLSYTKFTHISFIFLAPTPLYNLTGFKKCDTLLYSSNIRYFSQDHILYFLIATAVVFLIVIPTPFLLLCYTNKWFQKLIIFCRLNSHALTLFVDSFQGIYKDGTDGDRDLRFFAGIQFIIRFLIFGLYSFITDYFTLYFSLLALVMFNSVLYVIFRPFKNDFFNKLEPFLYSLFGIILAIALINNVHIYYSKPLLCLQIFFYFCLFIPAIYMGIYMSVWMVKKFYSHVIMEIRVNVDEEGQGTSKIGKTILAIQRINRKPLHTSILEETYMEDRIRESTFEEDLDYSASYVNYCETPTGSTGNTSGRPTGSTVNTSNRPTGSTVNTSGRPTGPMVNTFGHSISDIPDPIAGGASKLVTTSVIDDIHPLISEHVVSELNSTSSLPSLPSNPKVNKSLTNRYRTARWPLSSRQRKEQSMEDVIALIESPNTSK
jgi:hypothetical protein